MVWHSLKEGLVSNWNRDTVRFCAIFFALIVVFGIAYVLLRHNVILDPLLNCNAWLATHIWNVLGHSAHVDGSILSSDDFTFEISAECTSIVPTAILISGVLAWPGERKEKLIGIATGIAVLFIINLVRIITLLYVEVSFPDFLDIAHYFIWQALIVLIALGLWLFWVEKMVHSPATPTSDQQGEEAG